MEKDEKMFLVQELIKSFTQFKRVDWHHGSFKGVKKSEIMLLGTMIKLMENGSDGVKTSDLSARLNVTPGAITHMINSLEEGGYVQRNSDPKDRRIVLVRPTKKGEIIMKMAREKFNNIFDGLVDFLGIENSKQLVKLLPMIYEYFTQRNHFNGDK